MTGIQALERIAPTRPMAPGRVERREFEYIRHGTHTLIAGFHVATGKVTPQLGQIRTEEDFAQFLSRLLEGCALDSPAHLVMDNLNTLSYSPRVWIKPVDWLLAIDPSCPKHDSLVRLVKFWSTRFHDQIQEAAEYHRVLKLAERQS